MHKLLHESKYTNKAELRSTEHRQLTAGIRYLKEWLESKLNGQRDSHNDNSAYMWIVQNFDNKSLKYVVIDYFNLIIFQFKI